MDGLLRPAKPFQTQATESFIRIGLWQREQMAPEADES